ncbi:MAG TPA: chemotaxis protein CheW [Candidatus Methylacidiphilales bacterium]|jgi:purine-binding chemotaxis protein CheW|nr:chemotaxis protein CheW [Candidatus Methylacidiphilales bacterium]
MPAPALFLDDPARAKAAGKYLTFVLGGAGYGIPILKVREIIRLLEITPIPRMPDYVRGVINLRGRIVPVIDLRMKLGLPNLVTTNRTCIIVTHIQIGDATKLMGLIVDALDEVYQINAEDIEPAPDFGKGTANSHIRNMAKAKGQVKALLDIDRIVQDDNALLPPEAVLSATA